MTSIGELDIFESLVGVDTLFITFKTENTAEGIRCADHATPSIS
jgi:hypothetical protein